MVPGRHVITLQSLTKPDPFGPPVWTDFATRFASIDRTPGSEAREAARTSARVPVTFRIRYLSGVVPSMRLLCGGKVHEVASAIDPDNRKADLVITAVELVEETP
jgi:head-tail adaptor